MLEESVEKHGSIALTFFDLRGLLYLVEMLPKDTIPCGQFFRFLVNVTEPGFIALCSVAPTTAYASQEISQVAKDDFKYSHPCPSNGNNHGSCPGFIIDHITPLSCNGADAPSNMQWQSIAEGKAKDKWERQGCQVRNTVDYSYFRKSAYSDGGSSSTSSNNAYYSGSRGGCFTYTLSGKKRYVAHSFCGQ
jgi:hypothetical protein